jgi:hypothetical protein
MPRYTYNCLECSGTYDISHSYKTKIETCTLEDCSGAIKKVLGTPFILKKPKAKNRPGDLIKKTIEETRTEMESNRQSRKGYDK